MTSNARSNKRGATKSSGLKDSDGFRSTKAQSPRPRGRDLRIIYDSIVHAIYVLALEGAGKYRFTSVNAVFSKVTGLDPDQVIGKRVDEVIPEPSLTFVLGKYAEAIREQKSVRWEDTTEYPAGPLTAEVSVAPAFDTAGNCTHLVGAVHDITGHKQMEEEIRQHNTELEQHVRERTAELTERTEQLEFANKDLTKEVKKRQRAEKAALLRLRLLAAHGEALWRAGGHGGLHGGGPRSRLAGAGDAGRPAGVRPCHDGPFPPQSRCGTGALQRRGGRAGGAVCRPPRLRRHG